MSRTLALFSSLALAVTATLCPAQLLETGKPIVMTSSDLTPVPGETVTITVTFSSAATQNGVLNISTTANGYFSAMPTTVPVSVGDTSETFPVTLSGLAVGTAQLVAANSAGSAMNYLYAQSLGSSQESGLFDTVKF